jgi:hypothetical protein
MVWILHAEYTIVQVHAGKLIQSVTVKETLTVHINEYIPLHCMHIRWHADRFIAAGEYHQRPERVLNLIPLGCCRNDDLNMHCRLAPNQKEIGLIGAVSHHPCNRPIFRSKARRLPLHWPRDGAGHSEIPLRTGCDAAALSTFTQMAAGARMDRCAPDLLFEQRAKCGKSRIGG